MWILDNQTPYAAERNWIRDKQGAHHWLVAVKATFDIAPGGKLKLSEPQEPPALAPEYRGDRPRHAARRRPGEESARPRNPGLLCRVVRPHDVGAAQVHHRRICYESAFGGADLLAPDPSMHRIDARNPAGKGFTSDPVRLYHQEAHSIEYVRGDRPYKEGEER